LDEKPRKEPVTSKIIAKKGSGVPVLRSGYVCSRTGGERKLTPATQELVAKQREGPRAFTLHILQEVKKAGAEEGITTPPPAPIAAGPEKVSLEPSS
jgi:hypothetical protein